MSLLADRYAQALFSLALDNDAVEEYKDDAALVKESLDDAKALAFFASSNISKEEKKEILTKAFKGNVADNVLKFTYVLVDKGRMANYSEILVEFRHLCLMQLGIKEGLVESARPLSKEMINELETSLSKDGERIVLNPKINKTLISGFRISIDNKVIDSSMKARIKNMGDELKRKDGNLWN